MMNLRHIEVFHAVYQSGSVSAAARALNVSQPSVSKVLRHAESRIGFPLFRLVRGRLVATEEAHVLFHEARELYARVQSLQETTKNLRRGGQGHLRLAVLPSLGLAVAPAAVASFRSTHREVSCEIRTLHREDVLRTLYERNSDLAIVYDAPHHPQLNGICIGSGELVILFPRGEFPDAPERVSLDMFRHRDLIRLTDSGFVGSLFDSEISEEEKSAPAISVQTYYVAAALVRCGAGFAIVDEFTARANLGNDLDFRPLVASAQFQIFCTHLVSRPLSRLALDFVETLSKTLVSTGV
jgi:DNA-binding transcriptional LysR family regulator